MATSPLPASADWHRRAALASAAGDTSHALGCYERVLAIAPDDVAGTYYRGFHHYLEGDLDRAEHAYLRALALAPAHADAAWCLAMLRWLRGDLRGAWTTYERRLFRTGFDIHPGIAASPAWRGESRPGETLLLWAEQGNGDTIHFVRYAAMAKARVGRVVIACQRPLKRLLSMQPHLADAVVADGDAVPPFGLQASIMSLPAIFDTDAQSIPGACPYLVAPAPMALESGGRLKVGLVWGGNPHNQPMDRYRAMPFDALAPLVDLPGVRCYSLQVGPHAAGASQAIAAGRIVDLAPCLADFAETARALSALDLVVTVCTSVAHLAGALALPTLLMLAKVPDYRWQLAGDRSAWYPSLRLYRQGRAGEWAPVVAAVTEAVAAMARR